jgi:hypothetical protein
VKAPAGRRTRACRPACGHELCLISRMTRTAGAAELTGHLWTAAVADAYWLALSPSPVSPPPGLRGPFLQGMVTRFPDGQAPCGLP